MFDLHFGCFWDFGKYQKDGHFSQFKNKNLSEKIILNKKNSSSNTSKRDSFKTQIHNSVQISKDIYADLTESKINVSIFS